MTPCVTRREDVTIYYCLATETDDFLVLEDGETLILLYDSVEALSTCGDEVWMEDDNGTS